VVQLWATCCSWVYAEEMHKLSCHGTYTRWKSGDIDGRIAALMAAKAEHMLLQFCDGVRCMEECRFDAVLPILISEKDYYHETFKLELEDDSLMKYFVRGVLIHNAGAFVVVLSLQINMADRGVRRCGQLCLRYQSG